MLVILFSYFLWPPGSEQSLDLNSFSISLPLGWDYSPQKGEDSFVGGLGTSSTFLSFDYSEDGYSDNFMDTEEEYLQKEYDTDIRNGLLFKNGMDLNEFPVAKRIVKEFEYSEFPDADYVGLWTYKAKTLRFPIIIPEEIKNHNVHQKAFNNFYIKFVSPKHIGKGYFGIYFKHLNSWFTFSAQTHSFSPEDFQKMISLFKSIQFKNYSLDPDWVRWIDKVAGEVFSDKH